MANLKDLEKQVKELVEITSMSQDSALKALSLGVDMRQADNDFLMEVLEELRGIVGDKHESIDEVKSDIHFLIEMIERRIK